MRQLVGTAARQGSACPSAATREGRRAVVPEPDPAGDGESLAEALAGQLLRRWGVVFWELAAREELTLPWRDIVRALRRLEARGAVRGGRLVTGFAGEPYALTAAVEQLRLNRHGAGGGAIRLSGSDPLNLLGIILPGARIPAVRTARVLLPDGVPA